MTSPDPLPILRLTPKHAEAYRALMLEAYARQPEAFTSTVAEREGLPLAWWTARVSAAPDATQMVLGAFRDDVLVGVAGLAFATRPKLVHKATLFGMYVRDAYRKRGLGRRLVAAVLAHARQRPETQVVQLTVTETNSAAQRLYTACGFETFGVEPYAMRVGDRLVAKVHMWRRVRPLTVAPTAA